MANSKKRRVSQTLFPNEVDTSREYQVTRTLADNYIRLIIDIRKNTNKAYSDYLKTGVPQYLMKTAKGQEIGLEVAEEFLRDQYNKALKDPNSDLKLNKVSEKEAKALLLERFIQQHGSGEILLLNEVLWAYASLNGQISFNGSKLTDIMKLSPHKDISPYKADTQTKENFTTRLRLLNASFITLTDLEKGKESFFRFVMFSDIEYAKTKNNESLNKDVITRVWGELLPSYPKKTMMRGRNRLYNLLELNKRNQSKLFILNVYLANAFDQIRMYKVLNSKHEDDNMPEVIKKKRIFFIEILGLELTNSKNVSVASKSIENALYKCIGKSISDFHPKKISANDDDYIYLYPVETSEIVASIINLEAVETTDKTKSSKK